MSVAERLRISLPAARVNAGMLQKDVAKALHISNTTLVSWENGKTMPTMDKAQALAALYGLDVDDIIFCRKS